MATNPFVPRIHHRCAWSRRWGNWHIPAAPHSHRAPIFDRWLPVLNGRSRRPRIREAGACTSGRDRGQPSAERKAGIAQPSPANQEQLRRRSWCWLPRGRTSAVPSAGKAMSIPSATCLKPAPPWGRRGAHRHQRADRAAHGAPVRHRRFGFHACCDGGWIGRWAYTGEIDGKPCSEAQGEPGKPMAGCARAQSGCVRSVVGLFRLDRRPSAAARGFVPRWPCAPTSACARMPSKRSGRPWSPTGARESARLGPGAARCIAAIKTPRAAPGLARLLIRLEVVPRTSAWQHGAPLD